MNMINLLPKAIATIGTTWAKSLSLSKTSSQLELESQQGQLTKDHVQYVADRMEHIRYEMRRCVGELHVQDHHSLGRRIHFARDVQDLWYLRSDLMSMLSGASNERAARIQMQNITRMFHGLMPDSVFDRSTCMH